MPDKPFGLAVKAVILDDQNRCLLIRRSRACRHFTGQWEWPGGKADPGESFDQAILREVAEETSLQVKLTHLVGAVEYEMEKITIIVLCMEARATGGTLRLSDEHDDHAWVPIDELSHWDLTPQIKPLATTCADRING